MIPPRAWGHTLPGGSLAPPAWINFMASALKGHAGGRDSAARGVVHANGDWRYIEWVDGGFIPLAGPG